MKKGILISMFIILLSSAAVWAGGPDDIMLSPYNKDVVYRQEAAPCIEYVEKTWKFYKIGSESLRRIEQSTKAEYRSEKINFSVQLELENFRPGISTKIQFFKKPIYFVFTVTD